MDQPYFEWEDRRLRSELPRDLASVIGIEPGPVLIPLDVIRKIEQTHPIDAPYLPVIGQLLDGWRYAGGPPDRPGRYEVFGVLEGAWRTAVLGISRAPGTMHLITFHRVDEERVVSKRRRGYLIARRG